MRVYVKYARKSYLSVLFTDHCYEIRKNELTSRKSCLPHETYRHIIKEAYLQGLLSFNNKSVVVCATNSRGQQVSVVCYVNNTFVTVITVKQHWKPFPTHRIDFIREPNRINLFNFNFKLTNYKEAQAETQKSDLFKHRVN